MRMRARRLDESHAQQRQGSDSETTANDLCQCEHLVSPDDYKQGERLTGQSTGVELVVQFVNSFGAGLGGDDRGSNYHSNKGESNQEIMH
jgi:hypothetical protein